jgi:hypothetical protein
MGRHGFDRVAGDRVEFEFKNEDGDEPKKYRIGNNDNHPSNERIAIETQRLQQGRDHETTPTYQKDIWNVLFEQLNIHMNQRIHEVDQGGQT